VIGFLVVFLNFRVFLILFSVLFFSLPGVPFGSFGAGCLR